MRRETVVAPCAVKLLIDVQFHAAAIPGQWCLIFVQRELDFEHLS